MVGSVSSTKNDAKAEVENQMLNQLVKRRLRNEIKQDAKMLENVRISQIKPSN